MSTVGEMPFAVAVNSTTHKAYVLSYAADTMAVIDGPTGSVTKTVHLASHPQAIAVDTKTNRIYVANQRTADVTVFDGKTNAIVATIKDGHHSLCVCN